MIAVSGASGFLGSTLVCTLLEKGKNVRALRRVNSDLSEFEKIFQIYFQEKNIQPESFQKNLAWVIADVLDVPSLEAALTGVTEVYHSAGKVSFQPKDSDELMQINAEGTANMVNVSLQKGVEKFCHVSSIAAIGREKPGIEISEKTKWNSSKNNSNYAISKYKAEMEVWRAMEEGLKAVVVNPGVILGAGNWNKGSCRLFKMVADEMPFYTLGMNGYVGVKDVARAMTELMEKNIFHERFILTSANLKMKDFQDKVAENLRVKKPTIHAGKFTAQLAWRAAKLASLFSGKEPFLTKETARTSQNAYYYNSNKIREKINFQFTPIEKTLKEICIHFQKQNQK
ncbi:MAG: NAD-dependent epimerase/dehydratase family protein [Bacteroidia bacterium]